MKNIADKTQPFEPSVETILGEEAFRKLMDRDGQSPEAVKALMERIAQERSALR